jgi:hypothetical protein
MKKNLRILTVSVFALCFICIINPVVYANIGTFEIYEYSISHNYNGTNPWNDVNIEVQMTSPSGQSFDFGAFYYGSQTWKVRFSPNEPGNWRWRYRINGGSWSSNIQFTATASDRIGFIEKSTRNPKRWVVRDTGEPFYVFGWQDCINNDLDANVWSLADRGGLSFGQYLDEFEAHGFNTFRLNHANCSPGIFKNYTEGAAGIFPSDRGLLFDRFFEALHDRGIKIMFVPINKIPDEPEWTQAQYDKYTQYLVNRWGAYVDWWEISNEDGTPFSGKVYFSNALKQYDYYQRPWASNPSKDKDGRLLDGYGFESIHHYAYQDHPGDLERVLRNQNDANLPFMVTEVGHKDQSFGEGWPENWAAAAYIMYFSQQQPIFWQTSWKEYSRPKCCSNLSITDVMFDYFDYFMDFVGTVDSDRLRPQAVANSWNSTDLLTFGMSGPDYYLALAVNNTTETRSNVNITINPQNGGTGMWFDIFTGQVIRDNVVVSAGGSQQLSVPTLQSDARQLVFYLPLNGRPCNAGTPSTPSALTATTLDKQTVELNWSDNSSVEEMYLIERRHGSNAFERVGVAWKNAENFIDRTAVPGRAYTYRVTGSNCAGNGSSSSSTSVTTPEYDDRLISMERIDPVSPGATYSIEIQYEASTARDIILDFKMDKDPFSTLASGRVSVGAGRGRTTVSIQLDNDVPLRQDGYRWLSYLTEAGKGWSARISQLTENDVDCVAPSAQFPDPNKWYFIENRACANAAGEHIRLDSDNCRTVDLDYGSADDKQWRFEHAEGNYYFLVNKACFNGNSRLDTDSCRTVDLNNGGSADDKKWKVELKEGNWYWLIDKACGEKLDAWSNCDKVGTSAAVNGLDKHWRFVEAGNYAARIAVGENVNIRQLEANALKVYPNPASAVLNIESAMLYERADIYDLFGRLVQSAALAQGDARVDISSLANGLYVLRLYNGSGEFIRKFEVHK